jgi:hypothetical protein
VTEFSKTLSGLQQRQAVERPVILMKRAVIVIETLVYTQLNYLAQLKGR